MKRIADLFDEFSSFGNLWLAYEKAYKGCRSAYSSKEFYFKAEIEVLKLSDEIRFGSYHPLPYRYFSISDPKERIIAVAPFRDRVVHHAIVNMLEPIYEPVFDYHSYATRKGKGTHKAILYAQESLRKNQYFLKMDIQKYFDSVCQHTLKNMLQRKIRDRRFLEILYKIIDNGGENGIGLPIGNLTSQFLANVYLDRFDKYVRATFRSCAYIRYMDDFILLENSKALLKEAILPIRQFLQEELKLKPKEKALILNQRSNGLSFLGARIYPAIKRIHPKTLKRAMMTLNKRKWEYDHQNISESTFHSAVNSIVAHISWFDTQQLRKKLLLEKGMK
jgi:RNA-directed DNA polymerase